MTAAWVSVALAVSALSVVPLWWRPPRWRVPGAWPVLVSALALGAAALLADVLVLDGHRPGPAGQAVVVVAAAGCAVMAGGPVTAAVLDRLTTLGPDPLPVPADRTEVLRGGAWIGALERAAIVATLLAGWPEGVAIALAVKGLGRYPELRAPAAGAAERFIVGTFTSVLWSAACAGVATLTAG